MDTNGPAPQSKNVLAEMVRSVCVRPLRYPVSLDAGTLDVKIEWKVVKNHAKPCTRSPLVYLSDPLMSSDRFPLNGYVCDRIHAPAEEASMDNPRRLGVLYPLSTAVMNGGLFPCSHEFV
jgi:hypothetical protein